MPGERRLFKLLRGSGKGAKMFSVTFPSFVWKIKQPVCVGIQAVEEKRQGVEGQARLRRSIREASPSRLRVAVAGSGTAPATTYCTLTFPSSV